MKLNKTDDEKLKDIILYVVTEKMEKYEISKSTLQHTRKNLSGEENPYNL